MALSPNDRRIPDSKLEAERALRDVRAWLARLLLRNAEELLAAAKALEKKL
jgi:hypothetical protein